MVKTFYKTLLPVFVAALFFGSVAVSAHAATTDELQAQIAALLAQIAGIQGSGSGVANATPTETRCQALSIYLQIGATDATTGGQVTRLQEFLVSTYGLNRADYVTGYFGPGTQELVRRFQRENGLSPEGTVGPLTRAKIAERCGGTGGSTISSSGMAFRDVTGLKRSYAMGETLDVSAVLENMPVGMILCVDFKRELDGKVFSFPRERCTEVKTGTSNHRLVAPLTQELMRDFTPGEYSLDVELKAGPKHEREGTSFAKVGSGFTITHGKGFEPSCVITSSKTSVSEGEEFTLRWETFGMSKVVMHQDLKRGLLKVNTTKKGTQRWVEEPGQGSFTDTFRLSGGTWDKPTDVLCEVEVDINGGTATGDAIEVDFLDSSMGTEGGSYRIGEYQIEFAVEAKDGDVLIPTKILRDTAVENLYKEVLEFSIDDEEGDAISAGLASATLTSSATKKGEYFLVEEGEEETFTVDVAFDPELSAGKSNKYTVQLERMSFKVGSVKDSFYFDQTFKSGPVPLGWGEESGIDLWLNETEETLDTNSDTTTEDDTGIFEIKFDVTASDSDIFVPKTAGLSDIHGASFEVKNVTTNKEEDAGGDISATLSSTADTSGSRYVINEGETETFTLTVVYNPVMTGFYQVALKSFNFSKTNSAPTEQYEVTEGDVETDPLSISDESTAKKLSVTAPVGGAKWELNTTETVTWKPYGYKPDVNPSKDVVAYLEKKNSSGGFTTLGKVQESGKASIHWRVGELDALDGPVVRTVSPGEYYIRVVNTKTKDWDRSDAFTIEKAPLKLTVNGKEEFLSISDRGRVLEVAWEAGPSLKECQISGIKGVSYSTVQPSKGSVRGYLDGDASLIMMQCDRKGTAFTRYVSVVIDNNQLRERASFKILSPDGGERLDPSKQLNVTLESTGIASYSAALYKNDQWKHWIIKDHPIHSEESGAEFKGVSWTPSESLEGLGEGDNAGAVFKIYVTGQKTDGSGYIDDKSDTAFSFVKTGGSVTPSKAAPTGSISATACVIGAAPSTFYPTNTNVCDSSFSWSTSNATNAYVVISGTQTYTKANHPNGFVNKTGMGLSKDNALFWTAPGTYTLTLYADGKRPTASTPGTGIKLGETTITVLPKASTGEVLGVMDDKTDLSQMASLLEALEGLLQSFR